MTSERRVRRLGDRHLVCDSIATNQMLEPSMSKALCEARPTSEMALSSVSAASGTSTWSASRILQPSLLSFRGMVQQAITGARTLIGSCKPRIAVAQVGATWCRDAAAEPYAAGLPNMQQDCWDMDANESFTEFWQLVTTENASHQWAASGRQSSWLAGRRSHRWPPPLGTAAPAAGAPAHP